MFIEPFLKPARPCNKRMLFQTCARRYWKDRRPKLSPSTAQMYKKRLDGFYASPLADVRMSDLNGAHVSAWLDWLKKRPAPANKTRKSFVKDLDFLRTVLRWHKDFLNQNFQVPVTKQHKRMCVQKAGARPRRPDYYIQPEHARLWVKQLKERKRNPVYWRLAAFMLSTGARVSEACGLTWKETDLERGEARTTQKIRWDRVSGQAFLEEGAKTMESVRFLSLPAKLQELLREMKMKKKSASDLVFTDARGRPLKYNIVRKTFNDGFAALNLPWRATHICRHTYATVALMETKSLSVVQAALGHADIRMTQKYAKAAALRRKETGEKIYKTLFKGGL